MPPVDAPPAPERTATEEEERLAAEAAQQQEEKGEGFDGDDAGGKAQDDTKPQLSLPGTQEEITNDIGGRLPDKSTLKIVGGAVSVPGQYRKGDVIEAIVKLRVVEGASRDKVDEQTGTITETVRKHQARIIGLEVPE